MGDFSHPGGIAMPTVQTVRFPVCIGLSILLFMAIELPAPAQENAQDTSLTAVTKSTESNSSEPGGAYPSTETLARYAELGFPFTEKRLYAPGYSLGPVAQELIGLLEDTEDEDRIKVRREGICKELEAYRGFNPSPWAVQNLQALQEAQPKIDADRLVACLYAAERLHIVMPMDVLIEYCRLGVYTEHYVQVGGMGRPFTASYSPDEKLMLLPGAAAILHGGEEAVTELRRIALSTKEAGGVRLQAVGFLKELSPKTAAMIRKELAGENCTELQSEIDLLLSPEHGFGWMDVAGGVGALTRRIEKWK